MSTSEKLQKEIASFLAKHGMTQGEFGERAVGDKAFVTHLKRGRQNRADTIDRVRQFMAEYKAAGGKSRPSRVAYGHKAA